MNSIVEKYPKIFVPYEGNPMNVNWEIPEGWDHIIDWLCGSIQDYCDNVQINDSYPAQVQCTQVKEKWGQLEFYGLNIDERVDGMIMMAQYISQYTCIKCGSTNGVEFTNGHIIPLCKHCHE